MSSRVLRIANSTMQCHFDSYSRGRGQDREPITFDQERESMEEFKHSHIYANFASQEKMGDVYVIGLALSSIVVLGANSRGSRVRSALRRGCTCSKSTIFSTTHESSPMPVCSQHYTTTNRTKCISTFARHPAITDCNEPHIATPTLCKRSKYMCQYHVRASSSPCHSAAHRSSSKPANARYR